MVMGSRFRAWDGLVCLGLRGRGLILGARMIGKAWGV